MTGNVSLRGFPAGADRDRVQSTELFGSLKVERLHGLRFATCPQTKDEVIDWLRLDNERLAAAQLQAGVEFHVTQGPG